MFGWSNRIYTNRVRVRGGGGAEVSNDLLRLVKERKTWEMDCENVVNLMKKRNSEARNVGKQKEMQMKSVILLNKSVKL